jgi:hypothetical protein
MRLLPVPFPVGLAAGGGNRADAALEARHPLLEHGDGGVGYPRVDGAELLEREQVGGVGAVVEDEARGLVDRDRASAFRGVRAAAGSDRAGAKAPISIDD